PFNSDNTPIEIPFERFGKNEKAGAFPLMKPDQTKIRSAAARDDRPDTVISEQFLKALIGLRLLPERVDSGFSTPIDDNFETHGSGLEKLHKRMETATPTVYWVV